MSPDSITASAAVTKTERTQARARATRNRRFLVLGSRIALLFAVIGLWEWLARAGAVDPFHFSMPSRIWEQIRTWAVDGVPAVLVVRAKWALGSALCVLPAFVLGDLSGRGPVAEIVAWCAMVPLVRWYLRWQFGRVHGRRARPLTTRSPMR